MFQKVLLAVDGSEHGAKAVPVAADIARKSDGRGRSELAGRLLGSVAHKVIQLSHCPVVIAR